MQLYLGNEVWVKLTSVLHHSFKLIPHVPRALIRFFFHKMQQRLHFLTGEVQHWVQVVNHTVFKQTQNNSFLRLDHIYVDVKYGTHQICFWVCLNSACIRDNNTININICLIVTSEMKPSNKIPIGKSEAFLCPFEQCTSYWLHSNML